MEDLIENQQKNHHTKRKKYIRIYTKNKPYYMPTTI